jgi:hypothetical protein
MSYRVNMKVVELHDQWWVQIDINGEMHDRIAADSEDEAKRMLVDLVDMAVETGGKLSE